jgi:hypothetical protein
MKACDRLIIGHDPSRRIICVSYSGDLAKKHANDFRAVLESAWYRSAFPSTRVGPYKNSETEIELTARGFRLATSVGGTLTGRGGDIIVIDDPLKPDDTVLVTQVDEPACRKHESIERLRIVRVVRDQRIRGDVRRIVHASLHELIVVVKDLIRVVIGDARRERPARRRQISPFSCHGAISFACTSGRAKTNGPVR